MDPCSVSRGPAVEDAWFTPESGYKVSTQVSCSERFLHKGGVWLVIRPLLYKNCLLTDVGITLQGREALGMEVGPRDSKSPNAPRPCQGSACWESLSLLLVLPPPLTFEPSQTNTVVFNT